MIIKKEDIHEVIVCDENDSILEVSLMLRDSLSKHCIVVDGEDKPIGMISIQDIVYRGVGSEMNLRETSIKEIMSKELKTLAIETSKEELEELLIESSIHFYPITENGILIGGIDIWSLCHCLDKCERNQYEVLKK